MRDRKPDVRREDFKRWFGASTVVDARGNPLVVYHGTTVHFTKFTKSEDGGFHFGDQAAAGWRLADLTGDEATAGNRIIAAYLSIQHPKLLDFDAGDPDSWRRQIEQAKAEGFDGIRYPNGEEVDEDLSTGERPETHSWIAFEPGQIEIVMNKPSAMVAKTYEQVVAALVDQLYADTDLEQLEEIIEDGRLGVRQMTNRQLEDEWELQFSEKLSLTDPQENPNSTPPTPVTHAAMHRTLNDAREWLEQTARSRPGDVGLSNLIRSLRAVSSAQFSEDSARARPLTPSALAGAAAEDGSQSQQRRLKEIEEGLQSLGFGMQFDPGSMPGEGHILKRLSTDEMVDPDEEGVSEDVLALAAEWTRITDRDLYPEQQVAGEYPGHPTDRLREMLMDAEARFRGAGGRGVELADEIDSLRNELERRDGDEKNSHRSENPLSIPPHDLLRSAEQQSSAAPTAGVDFRSYIDPELHEFVIQALIDAQSCLQTLHAAKLSGLHGQLVEAVLEEVRETLDAAEDPVHRISAWRSAGASAEDLAAIARAGGYAAILDDGAAQTRFQDVLDRCVHNRLLEMRQAFSEAGWRGTPGPLAVNASGPVYEQLRKDAAGRTLLLAHRMTPNRGASDKTVAVTFEFVDIDDDVEPDSPGTLVLSMRDELTAPASNTVSKTLDRVEAVLRSRGIEVDLRQGPTTPDDQAPG